MHRATQIISLIELEIAKLSVRREPVALYDPMVYALQKGGKRVRPLLTVLGCELFTKNKTDEALTLALAFEVFHNFTLLHDDLMDQAPIRRGLPTVHKKWNANTAILSGDAMLVEAFKLIQKIDGPNSHKIFDLFAQTAQQVCEGQMYDMEFEQREVVQEEEYIEMIKLKTSVLLGACLQAGAWLGGASDDDAKLLYQYGLNVGLAFQLKDDLLDTFGDEKTFGKKTGGDILSAKKTYLVVKALESLGAQRTALIDALTSSKLNESEKIETVKKIFIQCNCDRLTLAKIEQYSQTASEVLNQLTASGRNTDDLKQLEKYLLNRDK